MGENEYLMQYAVAERLGEARAAHQALRARARQKRRAAFAIVAKIVENAKSRLMNLDGRAIVEG